MTVCIVIIQVLILVLMEYKNTSFKYICVSCIIVLILVLMEYKNTTKLP